MSGDHRSENEPRVLEKLAYHLIILPFVLLAIGLAVLLTWGVTP